MKSLKLLCMLVSLSSFAVAQESSNETNPFLELGQKIITEIKSGFNQLSDKFSKLQNSSSGNMNSETIADIAKETPAHESVHGDYMQKLYTTVSNLSSSAVKSTSDLALQVVQSTSDATSTVIKKASELGTTVVNQASEFGSQVSAQASQFGTTVANTSIGVYNQVGTTASELGQATTKFVEENKQAVIISSVVATALTVTALVRYNMYGYVFYPSKNDKNTK